MDDYAGALLADYKERNNDYRRQLRLYTTIITTIATVFAATLGWVLAAKTENRPYTVLVFGIVMVNVTIIILLFIVSANVGRDPVTIPNQGARQPNMKTQLVTQKTMLQLMLDHCASLSTGKVILFGVVLALAIEAFTVWMRFGLGLQSTRDTGLIGLFTFGIRIHHGYLGILLGIFTAWWFKERDPVGNICWMIAIALFMSDAFHHFLVLWPLTGSPQFHLVYPPRSG